MRKIFISYSIACIFGASILYKLVPYLLNYAPGYAFIDKEHGFSYEWQFVIMTLFALLIGYIIIAFFLRGVNEIESFSNNPSDVIPEKLLVMRRKLINLPYQLYVIQIAVPAVIVTVLMLPLFILESASLFVFFRVFILLIAFFSLVSIITLVISQTSLKRLLLKFQSDTNIGGIRIPLVYKLYLQVLPMFVIAISITTLTGYSNNIRDKGNLICEGYMTALNQTYSEYLNEQLGLDKIEELLYSINPVGGLEDIRFIITPDNRIITSDNQELGDYFLEYLHKLSLYNGGYVYDVTEEIRGVIINVQGIDGNYIVGIKFNIASTGLVVFYVISFLFILTLCSIVMFFLSKAMFDDILTVANSLNEIASGKYIGLDKKLPITSNDETSDLVIAFNKIQRLVQKHIKEIRDNHEVLIQQERMASLGQLIGGIAHSLKTPISTASDAALCLENLANEYDQSIDLDIVTKEDHHSIAGDMKGHIKDLKETLDYINSVINMVKNHSAVLDKPANEKFAVKDLIKGINILMANELRKHSCKLDINTNMDDDDEIYGDMGSLIQVINVLISNSIQAYAAGNGYVKTSVM